MAAENDRKWYILVESIVNYDVKSLPVISADIYVAYLTKLCGIPYRI